MKYKQKPINVIKDKNIAYLIETFSKLMSDIDKYLSIFTNVAIM